MSRLRAALAMVLLLAGTPAAAEPPVALDSARTAELVRLPALRGGGLEPDNLAGRAVLVSFFASWCPPCHAEFVALNRLHAAYAERGLAIVAVNLYEDFGGLSNPAKLAAFLDRYDPAFAVLRGDADTTVRLFGDVQRIPTVFVFAPDGRAVTHFVHELNATKTHLTYDELAAAVERALDPAPPPS